MTQRADLESKLIETEIWKQRSPREALDHTYEHYMAHARAAAMWYKRARKWKRLLGRASRGIALALVGLAGIIPFFSQPVPLPLTSLQLQIHPLYAAACFGAAAGLVALDRFFGWTSGWTRYVLTGSRIEHAIDEFQLEWQKDVASWTGPQEPTQRQIAAQLAKLKEFTGYVNGLVRAETEAWVAEFQAAAQTIETRVRSVPVEQTK